MPVERKLRAREIFSAALDLPHEERTAYLADACAGDSDLRADVDALLGALSGASRDGFLTSGSELEVERPGSLIGRYKLLQRIGEGGFGVVYMAEQREPVKRRVALKIIKLGMDTAQVVARFEAERQALAMMDHPNIAKVLDAGATEKGRPYFVMELVKGMPITKYCDDENVAMRERLALFGQVCGAVQHAHQKGVIHRDIKPSNVMVTLHDGDPVPKVIDFGIAKATDRELTDKTLFTEYGQFIGTPEYMSPEQAEMSGLDVDTRSDVYSLGVLLYELLTGTTPLENRSLKSLAFDELLRAIREDDPHKPSTRLSSMLSAASRTAETASRAEEVARHRRTDPSSLCKLLRGDLDWIVMRALEKDRQRRYETAAELALDVRRHLDDEPVVASPPSRVYRTRKFVRRHRMGVAAGILVAGALVAGLTLAVLGLARARREAENTRAVADFYTGMFASLNPFGGALDSAFTELTVADLVVSTIPEIDGAFKGEPVLEADVRESFVRTLLALGRWEDAAAQSRLCLAARRAAHGDSHPDVVEAMSLLSFSLRLSPRHRSEAVESLRSAHALSREVNGEDNLTTIALEAFLTDLLLKSTELEEAEALALPAARRARRVLGPEHVRTSWVRLSVVNVLLMRGRYEEAEREVRDVMEVAARKHPDNVSASLYPRLRLWFFLSQTGRFDEAERVMQDALEAYRRAFGDDHPWIPHMKCNLAWIEYDRGELAVAEEELRGILRIQRQGFGGDFADSTEEMLLPVLIEAGQLEEAEDMARSMLARLRDEYGRDGTHTLNARYWLGWTLLERGRLEEAERLLADVIRDGQELLPGGYRWMPAMRAEHGRCLTALGRYPEAESDLLEAYAGLRGMHGDRYRKVPACAEALVTLYEAWGRPEDAASWRVRAAPIE